MTIEIPARVLERHRAAAREAGADPAVVDTPEYRAKLAEVRATIHAGHLASFEEGLRYHLANPPATWRVKKKADKHWAVVNGAGHPLIDTRTKKLAIEFLTTGMPYRVWFERDGWYRGTSRDPRNRKFTAEEQLIIDRVLAEHDQKQEEKA
jgi:hypothetical protein